MKQFKIGDSYVSSTNPKIKTVLDASLQQWFLNKRKLKFNRENLLYKTRLIVFGLYGIFIASLF